MAATLCNYIFVKPCEALNACCNKICGACSSACNSCCDSCGQCCEKTCECCFKVCGRTCDCICGICETPCQVFGDFINKPFSSCVLFSCCMNAVPFLLCFVAILLFYGADSSDCDGHLALWLALQAIVTIAHILIVMHSFKIFQSPIDPHSINKRDRSVEDRIRHILCDDPLVAVYILIALFGFIWNCIGIGWIDDNKGCGFLYDVSVFAMVLSWIYYFMGLFVSFCSFCCTCFTGAMDDVLGAPPPQTQTQAQTPAYSPTYNQTNNAAAAEPAQAFVAPQVAVAVAQPTPTVAQPVGGTRMGGFSTPQSTNTAGDAEMAARLQAEENSRGMAQQQHHPARTDAQRAAATAEAAVAHASWAMGKLGQGLARGAAAVEEQRRLRAERQAQEQGRR